MIDENTEGATQRPVRGELPAEVAETFHANHPKHFTCGLCEKEAEIPTAREPFWLLRRWLSLFVAWQPGKTRSGPRGGSLC